MWVSDTNTSRYYSLCLLTWMGTHRAMSQFQNNQWLLIRVTRFFFTPLNKPLKENGFKKKKNKHRKTPRLPKCHVLKYQVILFPSNLPTYFPFGGKVCVQIRNFNIFFISIHVPQFLDVFPKNRRIPTGEEKEYQSRGEREKDCVCVY